MINAEVIEKANVGDPLLYQGQDHRWYSVVVTEVGRYNGRPIAEIAGYLNIKPTDKRLFRSDRILWDSSSDVYLVPEAALTGKMSTEELRALLEAATPNPILQFKCNEIMEKLEEIRVNYNPSEPLN